MKNDSQEKKEEPVVLLEEIRKIVESIYGIDISTRNRETEYVIARATYYHLAKKFTSRSLKAMGRSLGFDHATVLNGLRTWDRRKQYPDYNRPIKKCLVAFGLAEDDVGFSDSFANRIAELEEENAKLKDTLSKSKDSRIMRLMMLVPEKEKENVLLRIEAMVKMITATRLKKADLINKRISA